MLIISEGLLPQENSLCSGPTFINIPEKTEAERGHKVTKKLGARLRLVPGSSNCLKLLGETEAHWDPGTMLLRSEGMWISRDFSLLRPNMIFDSNAD